MRTFATILIRQLLAPALVVLTIGISAPAAAQVITDPRNLEFSPSADHNASLPDGRPALDHYEISFFRQGASAPIQTNSLGKPAPGSSGLIRIDLAATVVPWPLSPGTFDEARVAAVGPGGAGQSTPSNSFMFTSGCSYALSTTAVSLAASGGTGSLAVSTGTGCSWTTVSGDAWITVVAGSAGSGNGTVTLSASANLSVSARSGSVTIAGRTVTVTQPAGGSCSYTLSSNGLSFAFTTGTASVTVTAGTGCSWTAVKSAAWITVTGGSAGTGNGTVTLAVTANPLSSARSATVTIAGQTVTVVQAGTSCSYTLSNTALSAASSAGTASVGVTAMAGCSWTAVSNAAWITISAGSAGAGAGTVALAVTANPLLSARTGTATIAGQTVTVVQAGTSCSYTLSNTALSAASSAGTASVGVTAMAGCSWTAVSNAAWITISAGSAGAGAGTVALAVTANPLLSARTGTVTVAGQMVMVTQAGSSCTSTVSTTAVSLSASQGSASVAVTTAAGCTWTASSSAAWITLTLASSGVGSGSVALSVAANPSPSSRSAITTVAGKAVIVTQAGSTPLSVTSLRPNVVFPSPAGKPVTWTAAITGGTGPHTYRFWVYDGVAWTAGRGWNTSSTWTWEPPRPGTYSVQVWVRNAASGAVYDAWRQAKASISTPRGLTVTAVAPTPTSAAAGEPVTWTATVLGGRAPYSYQFWVYDGATWQLGSDWSSSSTWMWTPPTPGSYTFQVWVRHAGSTTRFDTYKAFGPFTATRPSVLTATALTSSLAAPTPARTPVTWTAVASGGTGPYTYQFWVFNGTDWSLGRDWSATATWTWIPPAAGTYSFQVWVRNRGSVQKYDSWRAAGPYTVGSPQALAVSTLVADVNFPAPQGTPVTWTASAVGGTGPYTYKFYVFDGATWSVGRDWSAAPTWTWVPQIPGTYSFQVWARNAGSTASYDAWGQAGPAMVGDTSPLAVTALTSAPLIPLVTGGPAVLTAAASGGNGPYEYEFWVSDGSSWWLGRPWSALRTFTWTPPAPGTYRVQVWVRNAGSATSWDAWRELGPIAVVP